MMVLMAVTLSAQVGISTDGSAPDNSALLEVKSTGKGFLPPRMTTAQRNAISSPAEGLVIYNTDEKMLNVCDGITWGPAVPVTCGNSFTDLRDGKIYNTLQIGTQCWMKENMNIGTKIPGNTSQDDNGIIEKYCYNDLEANCNVYGGLYQWMEAKQQGLISLGNPQGICPTGWHLPTADEFTTLMTFLGGSLISGGKMKESGLVHWATPNASATNSSGFTALPGGNRDGNSNFSHQSYLAFLWSATWGGDPLLPQGPFLWSLSYDSGYFSGGPDNLMVAASVRCVRN
jgi:uncharacterized protein (TIGR02145 family)